MLRPARPPYTSPLLIVRYHQSLAYLFSAGADAGRSEFQVSVPHFQVPSTCFFQTSTYLPRSLTGFPLASFMVTSSGAADKTMFARFRHFYLSRFPTYDEAGAGEHVLPYLLDFFLGSCNRSVRRQHSGLSGVVRDSFVQVFAPQLSTTRHQRHEEIVQRSGRQPGRQPLLQGRG